MVETRFEILPLPGGKGELHYADTFLSQGEAAEYFQQLMRETPWQQEIITIYGKSCPSPRLTAWYGDPGTSYRYSGILHEPLPWTPCLQHLRDRIEIACHYSFNSVLLNLYRDGHDSVGWHSDDEAELGQNPLIVSLSLGQQRHFLLKPKKASTLRPLILPLQGGSLLVMGGSLQHHWRHCVPKEKTVTSPRINLTFRLIREQ